jgi:hypothetical protein
VSQVEKPASARHSPSTTSPSRSTGMKV